MVPYVFIATLIFISILVGNIDKSYKVASDGSIARIKTCETSVEKAFLFVIILALCLVTGLRNYSIGNDTTNYVYYFDEFRNGISANHRIEIGYQLFCFLVGKITSNPHVFLLIYSVICYSALGIYVYNTSKNIPLSLCFLFCFFFTIYTNILRQGLALVFVLYGHWALQKNKNIIALILIVLAGFIHSSAFVCLLILLYRFFSKKMFVSLTVVFLSTILSFCGVFNTFIGNIFPQYAEYFGSQYEKSGVLAVSVYFIVSLFLLYLSFKHYSRIGGRLGKLAIFSAFLLSLSYSLGFSLNLFTRVADYFLFIVAGNVINSLETYKNKKAIYLCASLIMIAYFFAIILLRPEWNNLYPYKFFWR